MCLSSCSDSLHSAYTLQHLIIVFQIGRWVSVGKPRNVIMWWVLSGTYFWYMMSTDYCLRLPRRVSVLGRAVGINNLTLTTTKFHSQEWYSHLCNYASRTAGISKVQNIFHGGLWCLGLNTVYLCEGHLKLQIICEFDMMKEWCCSSWAKWFPGVSKCTTCFPCGMLWLD